jgi:DNA adenine methylase
MSVSQRRALIDKATPFLKWAGGKTQLLSQYRDYFPQPEAIHRYYEPFIGSAAVFFHLQPPHARLSDRNDKLIEIYKVVQRHVEGLIRALKKHKNDEDYYYQIRAQNPAGLTPIQRAARLIYLNKTCYNGLFRENSQGDFNVPFGRYRNPTICDAKRLHAAAQALQGVELCVADFEQAVEPAGPGDFIYFDPPYAPRSPTSNFTGYHRDGFSTADQVRLAETFHRLAARGCHVMLSNASVPLVYDLYDGRGYHLIPIQARRNINSKANGRGPIAELLITNHI